MLKKGAFRFWGICFILLFSSTGLALDFQPGEYEITSRVEMPGMTIPPQTISQCITQQDPIPRNDLAAQGCKMSRIQESGNTLIWEMTCVQQGQRVTSQGKMVYSGDTFKGTVTAKTGPQAGNMVITTTIEGRRVGDCR